MILTSTVLLTSDKAQDFKRHRSFFLHFEDLSTVGEEGIIGFKQGVGLDAESNVFNYL